MGQHLNKKYQTPHLRNNAFYIKGGFHSITAFKAISAQYALCSRCYSGAVHWETYPALVSVNNNCASFRSAVFVYTQRVFEVISPSHLTL